VRFSPLQWDDYPYESNGRYRGTTGAVVAASGLNEVTEIDYLV
jgi:hypothetical protein